MNKEHVLLKYTKIVEVINSINDDNKFIFVCSIHDQNRNLKPYIFTTWDDLDDAFLKYDFFIISKDLILKESIEIGEVK